MYIFFSLFSQHKYFMYVVVGLVEVYAILCVCMYVYNIYTSPENQDQWLSFSIGKGSHGRFRGSIHVAGGPRSRKHCSEAEKRSPAAWH